VKFIEMFFLKIFVGVKFAIGNKFDYEMI